MKRFFSTVTEGMLWTFIIYLFFFFSVVIIETARAQSLLPPHPEPAVYKGPTIPKCDKELWLRITEGCNGS